MYREGNNSNPLELYAKEAKIAEIVSKGKFESGVLKPRKIDKNCYLLDDYTKNLTEWEQVGGTGIKRLTHCADNSRKLWKGLAIKNLAKLGLVVA